jgi:hypothetical protein
VDFISGLLASRLTDSTEGPKMCKKVDVMDWPNDLQQVLKMSLYFPEVLCSCVKQKQHNKIS